MAATRDRTRAAPREPRADTRRNRERLLAAANDAFADLGAAAPLDEIARRAGLGSATIHRHFPSRYELMAAVYRGQIEALCATGRDLLAAPSPGEALAAWLRAFVAVAAERGLATALAESRRDEAARFFEECHEAIEAVGVALVGRAQQARDVRSDVVPGDLLRLANAVALATQHEANAADQAGRMLAIVLEGIRPPSPPAHRD